MTCRSYLSLVRFYLLFFLLLLLCACHSHSSLYDWGTYDASVHNFYTANDGFQLEAEILRLSRELDASEPGKIPPGKAAYVAYLYSLKENKSAANDYFEMERKLFPESAVFIDKLLSLNK